MRVALNKNIFSISIRKRFVPKLDFDLKLVKLKREKPQFKNFNSVLAHRIRQNFIDNYLVDSLKKDFFIKAYLRTNAPSLTFI